MCAVGKISKAIGMTMSMYMCGVVPSLFGWFFGIPSLLCSFLLVGLLWVYSRTCSIETYLHLFHLVLPLVVSGIRTVCEIMPIWIITICGMA